MYGQHYGTLVDWELKAAYCGDTLGFSWAILVLEAQAYLMEVLCNVVNKILDGVDPLQPPHVKKWRDLRQRNCPANYVGAWTCKTKNNTQEALTNDPLDWTLVQLQGEPNDQRGFNYLMLFAMLEDHLSNNPSERKRLDEVIYQTLSDLSTCHEMLLAVRYHRPQNAPRAMSEVTATEDREGWKFYINEHHQEDMRPVQGIMKSFIKDFYLTKPPTGPPTKDWLAHSRALRATLEKFWDLVEVISANLTPEYRQYQQQVEADILAAIRAADESRTTDDPQTVIDFTYEIEPESASLTITTHREKTKTRGTETSSSDTTAQVLTKNPSKARPLK
ncbi:hypothetical protein F53441_10528 [Fusarium austroafricanum]|uniref:Uncharacterized protein n=1 Tax=Fusarium austroafricanum TaxID=2364996 RepID=A0A8H4KB58_9HYPO|nr:hypothetical protein F53441_10528 [Fusarium austroafricanum]